ncbi:MAG: phospholipase D family protein [Elusimicrobiales bacterium]
MKYQLIFQSPDKSFPHTIKKSLELLASKNSWDTLFVAMAYATVAGVRNLLETYPNMEYKWILGTDDFITQPDALRLCKNLANSSLRIISFAKKGARFHPKTIVLSSKDNASPTTLITGSSNLTISGLTRNGEAIFIASSESADEKAHFKEFANTIWRIGHNPTSNEIENYEREYCKHRKPLHGPKVPQKGREILKDDDSEKDPSLSNTCWIELGKNTALGRELEFKSEQALFFGLNPHGASSVEKSFKTSDGNIISLWLKYRQNNGMWRLQLSSDIPEVANGLRPIINGKLGRSPFAAVFTRTKISGLFKLRLLDVKSAKYQAIRKQSLKFGTLGKTSAREYGWY